MSPGRGAIGVHVSGSSARPLVTFRSHCQFTLVLPPPLVLRRSSIAHPLATTRACLFMLCPPLKSLVVVRVKNFWQCNGFSTWAAVGSCSRCGSNTGHSCGPIKSERTHDQVDKSQLHYSAHSGMSSVTSTQIWQTDSSHLLESVDFAVKTS